MNQRHLLIAVLMLISSTDCPASESEISCRYDGTQQEMNTCAFNDYQVVDQKLNQLYRQVMAKSTSNEQKQLRQSQRDWIKKRDQQCYAEARDSEGGSIWPLLYYGCLKSVTEMRNQELQRIPGQ